MAIKIGDLTYEVPKPKGMRNWALQQRIFPIIGRIVRLLTYLASKLPARGSTEDGASIVDTFLKTDVLSVLPDAMPVLGQVFSEMPPGELEALTRELLADTTVDGFMGARGQRLFAKEGSGEPDAFDAVMQGRSLDGWKLLWHAVQIWYPDYFDLARAWRGSGKRASGSEGSTT